MWLKISCRVEEVRASGTGKAAPVKPLQGRWASLKPKGLHLKKGEGMPKFSEMNPTCNGLNNCRELWPQGGTVPASWWRSK